MSSDSFATPPSLPALLEPNLFSLNKLQFYYVTTKAPLEKKEQTEQVK